jgi:hypothetical protein
MDRRGSGEQFLEFHRGMIGAFRRILADSPSDGFAWNPWPALPGWLVEFFSWAQPGFLDGALTRVEGLVRGGGADDLGNFLESTLVVFEPFGGLHGLAHANVAAYEEHRFGRDHPLLRGAAMDQAETSPFNEHFWGLHGWIDDRYTELLERLGGSDHGAGISGGAVIPGRIDGRDRVLAGEWKTEEREN